MINDKSTLTIDQYYAERRKLGPLPSWWRPLSRNRWYAAEYKLYQRYEGWLDILRRLLVDVMNDPSAGR